MPVRSDDFTEVPPTVGEVQGWVRENPDRARPYRVVHNACGLRMWLSGRAAGTHTRACKGPKPGVARMRTTGELRMALVDTQMTFVVPAGTVVEVEPDVQHNRWFVRVQAAHEPMMFGIAGWGAVLVAGFTSQVLDPVVNHHLVSRETSRKTDEDI